ncbi:MAG: GTPase family protein [Granulosicoccus sp.]
MSNDTSSPDSPENKLKRNLTRAELASVKSGAKVSRLRSIFALGAILWALPALYLVIAGIVYLASIDILLISSIIWLAVTLASFFGYQVWADLSDRPSNSASSVEQRNHQTDSERKKALDASSLPLLLSERSEWAPAEVALWHEGVRQIELTLDSGPTWEELPAIAIVMLSDVANSYQCINKLPMWQMSHPASRVLALGELSSALRFTVPELLLVFSEATQRYRQVVINHLPFAETINIGSVLQLYQQQETIRQSASWINSIRRTVRLLNPIAAVSGELREQLTQRMFSHAGRKIHTGMQRLLLQELLQVTMDLQSGRLKSSDEELISHSSTAYKKDQQSAEEKLEPLRIALIGQTNSGKSSLVNALLNQLRAETDSLPSTDRSTVYVMEKAGYPLMHFIDMVGLDSPDSNVTAIAESVSDADIIVHLVKANQPARSAHNALYLALQKRDRDLPLRRMPPAFMVMTHIDQLSPKALWNPPYDMSSEDMKAANIRHALESARAQIGLPEETAAVPVCLSEQRGLYNVEAVLAQLMLVKSDAIHSQLNRRRLELGQQGVGWTQRWEQLQRFGRVLGQSVMR